MPPVDQADSGSSTPERSLRSDELHDINGGPGWAD